MRLRDVAMMLRDAAEELEEAEAVQERQRNLEAKARHDAANEMNRVVGENTALKAQLAALLRERNGEP